MKLIDTDILIDHFHGHHAALNYLAQQDALIAASAKLADAEIVTRNRKHYPMPDISIVVPYERGQQ